MRWLLALVPAVPFLKRYTFRSYFLFQVKSMKYMIIFSIAELYILWVYIRACCYRLVILRFIFLTRDCAKGDIFLVTMYRMRAGMDLCTMD